jgi:hypothetical protein
MLAPNLDLWGLTNYNLGPNLTLGFKLASPGASLGQPGWEPESTITQPYSVTEFKSIMGIIQPLM